MGIHTYSPREAAAHSGYPRHTAKPITHELCYRMERLKHRTAPVGSHVGFLVGTSKNVPGDPLGNPHGGPPGGAHGGSPRGNRMGTPWVPPWGTPKPPNNTPRNPQRSPSIPEDLLTIPHASLPWPTTRTTNTHTHTRLRAHRPGMHTSFLWTGLGDCKRVVGASWRSFRDSSGVAGGF